MINRQSGKSTLFNLILFVVVCYGGYATFKYLEAGSTKKQIKKDVYDTLGVIRGSELTPEKAREAILKVMTSHNVDRDSGTAQVEVSAGKITYEIAYSLTVDYLLFKKVEQVNVRTTMDNYGL